MLSLRALSVKLFLNGKDGNPIAQKHCATDYRSVNTLPPELDWPICLAKGEGCYASLGC
jgi:hypothetical protein